MHTVRSSGLSIATLITLAGVMAGAWIARADDVLPPLRTVWRVEPAFPTLARWHAPMSDEFVFLPGQHSVEARARTSGDLTWTQSFPTSVRSCGLAGSLLIVGGIVGTQNGTPLVDLHALDAANGALRWQAAIGGVFVEPLETAERLIVASTHALVAFDLAGRELWRQDFARDAGGFPGGPAFSGPALAGDLVVVGAGDARLHAFDLASGEERWTVALGAQLLSSPVVCPNGAIVVAAGRVLRAFSADGRTERWQVTLRESPQHAQPVVAAGGIVYVTTGNGASLVAIDSQDGRVVWETNLRAASFAAPIVTPASIITADTAGWVYAFDPVSGRESWRARVLDSALFDPILDAGQLLVGGDRAGFVLLASAEPEVSASPGRLRLAPNPVRGALRISGLDGRASLFSASGRRVAGIDGDGGVTEWTPPPGLANGVYFLRYRAAGQARAIKIELLR